MLLFLLFALAIGTIVAWGWSAVFDTHGPWNSFFWFFVVIFLFSWGGGSWIAPFGPTGWGVAWMPIVFMGVFMALLLTAVTPRTGRSRTRSTDQAAMPSKGGAKAIEKTEVVAAVDFFFWALILVLGCVVMANFMWHTRVI